MMRLVGNKGWVMTAAPSSLGGDAVYTKLLQSRYVSSQPDSANSQLAFDEKVGKALKRGEIHHFICLQDSSS